MDWTQVITIVGSNIAMFFWARSESRADYRELRAEQRASESWVKDMLSSIQEEIKDFHARLYALEKDKWQ